MSPARAALSGATGSSPSASGSPDRCAASPPGNYAALRFAPGGGASACPGYRSTAVCHTVARTDAQHRLREIMPHCALLPGAAQSSCPGYRSTAVCHTVARTDAQHRLRGIMPHCTLLPGAAQAPARATGPPPSAIPSPGQMRSIASGKLCRTAFCSRGRRKAPARATGPPPSAIPSPGQMRSIASGKLCRTALCSRGRRKRLPGLQVHLRLPYRSPDRCAASPPGNYAALRSAPGGGASACPGYRSTAVCEPVARGRAAIRSPGYF